jgi:NAD+ synthase (glutamine-hydrolysing)
MKDGFIKVAACTPQIRVADCNYNTDKIIEAAAHANAQNVKICVFPELCITGYTCQDLFYHDTLLNAAMRSCLKIAESTRDCDMLLAVGLPVKARGKIYNCAAVIWHGKILNFVPKTQLPNYNEFYEARHFAAYDGEPEWIQFSDNEDDGALLEQTVLVCENIPELKIGFEICEDLWVADPVSNHLAKKGATLICNLSASNEVIGKEQYRRQLVSNQSARLVAGYVYCSAGDGESTQDMVFSGHNIIAENGTILAESRLFENGMTVSEIDFKKLAHERRKMSTYPESDPLDSEGSICTSYFTMPISETSLTRTVTKTPFIPQNAAERNERCHLILQMQSHGLMKRISHTHAQTAVIGISGGLDSTLALLVCIEAMDLLNRPHTDIVAVTMPCFGTTKRTRSNAEILCEALGVTFREVDISKSVLQHFADIGHDYDNHNVVFENGQARERTKVLMNIANQCGGLVIGTGDLSELALGWATYNGDHMSMYGVNASVPKTLVRHIVQYYADTCGYCKLSDVLYDILDTPVSPELLPTDESGTEITQKTEDLVGPYELHDFFLYHAVRWGCEPRKVKRLAVYALVEDILSAVFLAAV